MSDGLTRAEIDQMQDDLVAMVKAWADRGIHPTDSAMLLMATSHVMVHKFTDLELDQVIVAITHQWSKDRNEV